MNLIAQWKWVWPARPKTGLVLLTREAPWVMYVYLFFLGQAKAAVESINGQKDCETNMAWWVSENSSLIEEFHNHKYIIDSNLIWGLLTDYNNNSHMESPHFCLKLHNLKVLSFADLPTAMLIACNYWKMLLFFNNFFWVLHISYYKHRFYTPLNVFLIRSFFLLKIDFIK